MQLCINNRGGLFRTFNKIKIMSTCLMFCLFAYNITFGLPEVESYFFRNLIKQFLSDLNRSRNFYIGILVDEPSPIKNAFSDLVPRSFLSDTIGIECLRKSWHNICRIRYTCRIFWVQECHWGASTIPLIRIWTKSWSLLQCCESGLVFLNSVSSYLEEKSNILG